MLRFVSRPQSRRLLSLVLSVALLTGLFAIAGGRLIGAGLGQATVQEGLVFRGLIVLEGRQIPLPPGDWRVVARSDWTLPGSKAPAVSVALFRINGRTVEAAALFQTNRAGASPPWGKPNGCARADFLYARIGYASDHDLSCAYVAFSGAIGEAEALDPAWSAALRQAIDHGWSLPTVWIAASYRIADPRDGEQVRYLFRPPAMVTASLQDRIVAWTDASWTVIGSGFRNRLGSETAEMLQVWPEHAGEGGAVRWDRGATAFPLELKAASFRVLTSMANFGVAYAWLGSAAAAGGLSLAANIAGGALYAANELVWTYADSGRAPIGDLPGVGHESALPH
jgi:uncharacterized membrane protein